MTALHRLCIVWAVLGTALGVYNLAMTGTHPVLTLGGMAMAIAPAIIATSLPNLIVLMWFALMGVLLMSQPATNDIEGLLIFVLGIPAVFRTGWWVLAGLFTKK